MRGAAATTIHDPLIGTHHDQPLYRS
jgi:hypothetical protein